MEITIPKDITVEAPSTRATNYVDIRIFGAPFKFGDSFKGISEIKVYGCPMGKRIRR